MDLALAVFKIYGPIEYNPACFDFSEEEARKLNLWRDEKPMPTKKQLKDAWDEVEAEIKANEYKSKRKDEYLKEGLTLEKFVELLIEDDKTAIAEFKSKRNEVKSKIPKDKK